MVGLTAVHPDGVGIGDSKLGDGEVARLVIGDRDAVETINAGKLEVTREDLQSGVEPISCLDARRCERRLSNSVILLFEYEGDRISGVGVLRRSQDRHPVDLCGIVRTTNSGLYFKIPIPPTVTWWSAPRVAGITRLSRAKRGSNRSASMSRRCDV